MGCEIPHAAWNLSKVRESVKEKKVQKRYQEEFKREAVELVIHSGKSQA